VRGETTPAALAGGLEGFEKGLFSAALLLAGCSALLLLVSLHGFALLLGVSPVGLLLLLGGATGFAAIFSDASVFALSIDR
jgi:hypothetical protein